MARSKISCRMVPEVPGTHENSKMYVELSDLIKNRPLTNFIYASYLQPGIADEMDAAGYTGRNSQGQHRARDIFAFFEVGSMKGNLNVEAQAKALGFADSTGNLIDFDGVDAYTKAQEYNQTHKGAVATVVSHGDKFNVLISEKDSRTQAREAEINQSLAAWSKLGEELTARGIDLNVLSQINPAVVNPGNVQNFLRTLNTFKHVPNDAFSVKDIEMMLALNYSAPIVQNAMTRGWGNREQVAQRVFDIIHSTTSPASSVAFANNLIDSTKTFPHISLKTIFDEVKTSVTDFKDADPSSNIQKTLVELDKKYNLESEVLVKKNDSIKTYSDAVVEAIMTLQRQIRKIEDKSGKTQKSEQLSDLENKLFEELKYKKYESGLLEFMQGALNYINQVQTALQGVTAAGTNMEYAHALADVTSQAINLRNAYYDVVRAISDTSLVNDFALSDADKTTLKDLARSLKQTFDEQEAKVKELQEEAMRAIGKEFIGDYNSLYGKDVADIINIAEADASMMDYLYSIGRCSNTVVSMLGAIIRDAQLDRDNRLQEMALRINRANHLLVKDGKDSTFMYDDKGRIVSQYDWDAYSKAKREYAKDLYKQGLKRGTLAFEQEMKYWEKQNTHEVVVDAESGRTERMPNFFLDEDFREGWSAAQNEYYDRMMQIKGEIGTLLPNYAQHQYLAPQKRTTWDQVLKEAIKGQRDFDSVFKWWWGKIKTWNKVRDGENKFRSSGIYVGGEESIGALSDYDNSILRQIPIFYTKRIDANDLSHDFSSAIQALASTALNYDAMYNIKNIAEMMTDYSLSKTSMERDADGRPKMDTAQSEGIGVAKALRKVAQSNNTSTMLDSFVLKHIYGVENKSEGKWAVICGNLIGYTSLKGLAVNVKGALTNKYVGVIQAMIRAFGNQYFNYKDLAKAWVVLTGAEGASTAGMMLGGVFGGLPGAAIGLAAGTAVGAVGMTGKLIDIVTDDRNSKDTLIADFFDDAQEVYSKKSDRRYHSTVFGRLFGSFSPMAMYERGEYWIHMLNVYSMLFHEKVVQADPETGEKKTISLYEALEKGDKIDGNTELKLKEGIYRIDGVKLESLSDKYFDALKRRVRYVNQQCHGSMNKEDKGLIHQWMLGKMTMNFRQWMVEHYSSRWRGLHWDESIRDVNLSNFYTQTKVRLNDKKVNLIDALEKVDNPDGSFHYEIKQGAATVDGVELTDEVINNLLAKYSEDTGWRRGFKTSAFKTLVDYTKELIEYKTSANAYWNSMSETQKADVRQVLGEATLILALSGLSLCMGDPNDHKGEFWYRMWMYVVRRCLFDEKAATAMGGVIEAKTVVNNPIAMSQTVAGLLYPIYGLLEGDYKETIKSGRHKGENKYWKNIKKYTFPFYGQIDQMLNMDKEDALFQTFENQITR